MSEAVAGARWPAEWPKRSIPGLVLRSGCVLGLGALLLWTGVVSIGLDDVGSVIGSVLVLAGVALVGTSVIGIVAEAAHRPRRLTVVRGRSERSERSERFDEDGVAVPGARGVAVASAVAAGAVALTAGALLLAPGPARLGSGRGVPRVARRRLAGRGRGRGRGPPAARGRGAGRRPGRDEYRSPSASVAVDRGVVVSIVARAPYRGRLVGVVLTGPAMRR